MGRPAISSVLALLALPWVTTLGETQPHFDKAVFEQHRNGTQTDEVYASEARRLRQFLWLHWLKRSRGQATVRYSTVEGDVGTTVYEIGPDEQGLWRMHLQHEGEYTDFDKGKSEYRVWERDAYDVERVKPRGSSYDPFVRIATRKPVLPSKYRLVLKDRGGKILAEL